MWHLYKSEKIKYQIGDILDLWGFKLEMQDLDCVLRTAAIEAGVKLVVAFGMDKAIY